MYDSWVSLKRLFIKGKKHGRMMIDSIDICPLVYPTVEENGQIRTKKYSELTEAQQLQDCVVMSKQQTSFFMVFLQMCMHLLYNLFDKFTYVQGETLFSNVSTSLTIQSYAGIRNRGNAITSKGNYVVGQPRVVKRYNCQGEGHMARQCTQPKRPRNTTWFKEKLMLAEAQEAGQSLDEEQLTFLVDPKIDEALVAQQTIP
ncbi:retrovirus-related pol polyprotein from transposon TNT 1-94 [Tanacetum coccineum]